MCFLVGVKGRVRGGLVQQAVEEAVPASHHQGAGPLCSRLQAGSALLVHVAAHS